MARKLMMVLNDGETYTNLEGCMIVQIDDSAPGYYEEDENVRAVAAGQGYGQIVTVFTDPND